MTQTDPNANVEQKIGYGVEELQVMGEQLLMRVKELVHEGNVRRAVHVVVKGQDTRGKPMRISAEGYFAWALQHEIDHLNGVLYLDRLDRPEDLREVGPDNQVEDITQKTLHMQ